ncbi:MAG: ATP-binding protein [Clostridia bacterium]|nr:ATP-binding protein [Clostridia bacterium]
MTEKHAAARGEIARRFEEKRTRAESAAESRRAALKAKDPAFSAICEEKESYLEKILLAFTRDAESAREELSTLRASHAELREREAEYLKKQGLSADYLLPHYECEVCGDRGYVDGRMCACMRGELNRLLARESGLFSLFEKQTFESFSTDGLSEKMRENFDFCREYAAEFDPRTSTNLLFVGGTGVGKTHLSSAIGRAVLEKGYGVVYEGAMTALSAMEMERYAEEKPQSNRLMEADLLILDDLGTELPGKGTVSFLYLLLNARLIANRPTIISTNLSARELETRYESRLFSRLTGEYEVLLFDGEDRRGRE